MNSPDHDPPPDSPPTPAPDGPASPAASSLSSQSDLTSESTVYNGIVDEFLKATCSGSYASWLSGTIDEVYAGIRFLKSLEADLHQQQQKMLESLPLDEQAVAMRYCRSIGP